jgi:hypothetical protein
MTPLIARRPPPPPEFGAERVRDISLAVYLERLGRDGTPEAIAKLGLEKIRERAKSYDPLTRAYLRAIRDHQPTPTAPAKVPKSRRLAPS